MFPAGIAGKHHASKPPIWINDQVVAIPILSGGGTNRAFGDNGSIALPPNLGQSGQVKCHTWAGGTTSYNLVQPQK